MRPSRGLRAATAASCCDERQPGDVGRLVAVLDGVLESGDPDHEELVEVRGARWRRT